MASQPSTTGAETSQDPLQKSQSGQFGTLGTSDRETTTGACLHPLAAEGSPSVLCFPMVLDLFLALPAGGEQMPAKGSGKLPDGDKGNGSCTGQQQSMQSGPLGLADKARQALGDQLWLTLRQTMAAQAQELQQQVSARHAGLRLSPDLLPAPGRLTEALPHLDAAPVCVPD